MSDGKVINERKKCNNHDDDHRDGEDVHGEREDPIHPTNFINP
jgi:hypothetical protein